jgi:hypothetical protein
MHAMAVVGSYASMQISASKACFLGGRLVQDRHKLGCTAAHYARVIDQQEYRVQGMIDDDAGRQRDELEACASIFGDDCIVDVDSRTCQAMSMSISLRKMRNSSPASSC